MGIWQPLLAATPKTDKHWAALRFPMMMQPKADGVRAVHKDGMLRRRKLDPVLNRRAQALFGSNPALAGLDGELIYGDPCDPDVYRYSNAVVSRAESPSRLDFYVWDDFTDPELGYEQRYQRAKDRAERLSTEEAPIIPLETRIARDLSEAKAFSEEWEELGWEGGMGKLPSGKYKLGRSTVNEGLILKFKSWVDEEAIIIGYLEARENQNEATEDNRGYTKRSSHQENKIGKDTLGSFIVKNVEKWPKANYKKMGPGIYKVAPGHTTDAMKQWIWDNREDLLGQPITYKYQPSGSFEAPRFPIFKRFFNDVMPDEVR